MSGFYLSWRSLSSPCSLSPTLASPCFPRSSLQGSVLLKTLPRRHCSLFIVCPPPSLSLGPLLAWTPRRTLTRCEHHRESDRADMLLGAYVGQSSRVGKVRSGRPVPALETPFYPLWWLLWKRKEWEILALFHSILIPKNDLGVQMSSSPGASAFGKEPASF